jgi:hypothetical protein
MKAHYLGYKIKKNSALGDSVSRRYVNLKVEEKPTLIMGQPNSSTRKNSSTRRNSSTGVEGG